jgi:transketolase
MQPSLESMDDLGWEVIKVENGHDLPAVYEAVAKAVTLAKTDRTRPVCVWVKTIKGYGIQTTMDDSAGGHGYPLSSGEKIVDWIREIYKGEPPPSEILNWAEQLHGEWERQTIDKTTASKAATPAVKKDKIQAGLPRAAIRAAIDGYPVYSISSDVQGSTGMSGFHKTFPDRFVEVGIAEANMVSVGAGFAKMGFIPIVDTFGQFGVTKGNLPLTMAALSQAPVIAVFSHVGFQDAADGASHQATTYLAAVSAIPRTVVIAPSCADEAEALMYAAVKQQATDREAGRDGESYVFFVGREGYPVYWVENAAYPWGKAQIIQEGTEVVLVGCGPLVSKAIAAGRALSEQGIKAAVVNNPFVNRIDLDTLGPLVKGAGGRIVTIEDHQQIAGMGAQLSHALARDGVAHRMTSLAIPGEFGQSAYKAEHLYEKHGLTAARMVEAALVLLAD